MPDKAEFLYDDFAEVSGKWYASDAATGIVTGGQMRLVPTEAYHYVEAVDDWDLTKSAVCFELVENAKAGLGSIATTLSVGTDWDNAVEFEIAGGRSALGRQSFTMREIVAEEFDGESMAYFPATHRWFRLREDLGVVYWETSADGAAWTVRRSKATVLDLSSVSVRFVSSFWDAETDPGYASIDNVNLAGGVPGRPKAQSLTDDFAFASANNWVWGDAQNQVIDGQLQMMATDTYSPLWSVHSYDLTDSFIVWEVAQNLPAGNGTLISDVSLCVGEDLDNRVTFAWDGDGGYLTMIERVGGVNDETATALDPARHRWLRIRESGGTVYWDTSGDGAYWVNRRSKATGLDLSAGKVRIYTGYYGSEDDAPLRIDNVNLPLGNDIGGDIPLSVSLLADRFDDDDEVVWSHAEGWAVIDGQLVGTPSADYEWMSTNDTWDLTGAGVTWQVVQNTNQGSGNWDGSGSIVNELAVSIDGDNSVRFMIGGGPSGTVVMRERVAGSNSDDSFIYNANLHKWFRIRESGATVYWETSNNGVTWTVQRVKATTLDLSAVTVGMTTGFWDDEPGDLGTVIIDNVNLPDLTLGSVLGWSINSGRAWGGVAAGTLQARHYFPGAEWYWGKIPDDPVLDDHSAEIGALLAGDGHPAVNHSLNHIAYGNAVVLPHQISASTPRYTVYLSWPDEHPEWGLPQPFTGYTIPIPLGTQVPPGSDSHLGVMDPTTGKVFSLWQARYDEGTDTWSATYGGLADLDGDGRDYIGSATATNLSRLAGIVTIAEIEAGEIPHALFLASNMCAPGNNEYGFRYPATKSDGGNIAGVAYPVEQGSRIQLDPAVDLNAIPNLRPVEKAIGRAMQRYGGYIGDKGGINWPPTFWFSAELWQGQTYPAYPFDDDDEPSPDIDIPTGPPYRAAGIEWDYFNLDRIPWEGNLRVLRQWDGQ